MTTAVDIQEVLTGFQTEIGNLTQRAVIAEVTSKKQELEIARLTADNEQLRSDLTAQLVIAGLAGGDTEHVPAPEATPTDEIPDTFKGKAAAKR